VRLLLHSINFAPELTGIGKVNGELVAWLAARGHEVRVLTAPPYYPEWRVHAGHSAWRYTRTRECGAEVFRSPLWVPSAPGGFKRLLHLGSFALTSLPNLARQLAWRPEVVLVVEPPLFCAPGALLLARLTGARAWLHIQDFEVDAAFELGLLKSEALRGAVRQAEAFLMRRFDALSSISQAMVERAGARAGRPDVRLLPNWVDCDHIRPQAGANAYRQQLGIGPEETLALYSGNLGRKQGIDLVVEAAGHLAHADTRIHFLICGRGVEYEGLKAATAGLAKVHWLPLQPYERLPELLAAADVHLLPQKATAADLVMPSKLPSMLASGRAVLATAEAGTEVARTVAGCGEVVPPGSVAAFVAALTALAADPARRAQYAEAARARALAEFSRDAILERFEASLLGAAS
jgi:colanic acid biosynthesis glycosyl transferase WcaI